MQLDSPRTQRVHSSSSQLTALHSRLQMKRSRDTAQQSISELAEMQGKPIDGREEDRLLLMYSFPALSVQLKRPMEEAFVVVVSFHYSQKHFTSVFFVKAFESEARTRARSQGRENY
uniref:Uncharacterized protein n=1 Tax=Ditylenchus dipsaci TaxID=166011 RepID=A0A915DU94_9BILA